MAKRQKYQVPFITETVNIWEVEATSQNEATMIVTLKRAKYLDALTTTDSMIEDHPDKPKHTHVSKDRLGKVSTVESLPAELDTQT